MSETAKQLMEIITPEMGKRAVILALEGPLGAGKTTLTKELAKLLGIKENITSPTFVLNVSYRFRIYDLGFMNLEHLDVWRLEGWNEVERLGLQKMIDDKSLIVIEWADRFREQLISESVKLKIRLIWVKIEYGEGEERKINLEVL